MKRFFRSYYSSLSWNPIVALVVALSPFCSALSQDQPPTHSQVPSLNIVPASPEAASLGKYGDIPVGLYTGVPNISIPLYTIELKGVTVPISLSYHSAGVKADELASNVGLGWTLNYGGVVTSSVHGIPDDFSGGGWLYVPESSRLLQDELLPNYWESYANGWLNDPDYEYMSAFADGSIDSQPDLYYINMNGRSFKLFYDQNGKPYTMPYQRVRIQGTGGGITVTDEGDNVYKFHKVETATTQYVYWGYGDAGTTPFYPHHTYYISAVETPYGEKVSYEYEDYSYSFENQPSETRYAQIPGEYFTQPLPATKRTESVTHVSGKRIKRITTNRGHEVIFTYGFARKDLVSNDGIPTMAMTGVQILNAEKEPVATYKLNYDHFSAPGDQSDPNTHRLRLLSVAKEGLPPHMFKYGITPPPRLSRGQDHWGYINNLTINPATLLPADPARGFDYGANREPDATAAQAGILKKITYPTGGSTTFSYELNQALTIEYVPASGHAEAHYLPQQEADGTITWPDGTIQKHFEVGEGAGFLYASYESPGGDVQNLDMTTGRGTVILYSLDRSQSWSFSGQAHAEALSFALPQGKYFIEIVTQNLQSPAYLELSWEEPGYNREVNKAVGGLRVESITDHPVEGTPKVQRFEYHTLDDTTKSSGILNFAPEYVYRHYVDYLDGVVWNRYPFYAQSSSSLAPLGTVQGGPVAYRAVTVYTEGKTKGYTTHSFSHKGGGHGMWEYPFGPVINYDWVNGLPLETVEYVWHEETQDYTPVRRVRNRYKTAFGENDPDQVNSGSVRGAKVLLEVAPKAVNYVDGPFYNPRAPRFGISYYTLYSSWSYPTERTEKLYDPADSTQKVTITRLFYYDNPKHIQPTREEVTKGEGENYLITYRYPLDVNEDFAYNASPVVEKRVFLNGTSELLSAELTEHENRAGAFPLAFYSLYNTAPLPGTAVAEYTGDPGSVDPAYQRRLSYTYRENGGNRELASQQLEGGILKTYLWDYQGLYPVAEALNAAAGDIAYTSFEAEGKGGWLFSSEEVPSATGYTGRRHYDLSTDYGMIRQELNPGKVYIVSLWVKGNGSLDVSGTAGSFISPAEVGATADGWTYREYRVSGSSAVGISGTALVDEVRLYPVDGQMTTYTYEPLKGVESMTAPNGRTSRYEYDGFGRLKSVKDHEGNVLKSHEYHFRQTNQ